MTLETFKLGDIADVSWGDTKTTKASYVNSGYPAYSATGQDGYLDHFDYNEPGIVVSAIGAQCGKSWFASGKWSCIKNTIRILAKPGVSDARYLYYAACSPNFFPNRGSAQPFIAQSDARDIRINLPPLDEQRRIAGVLGALDDLIEVNRGLIRGIRELSAALVSRAAEQAQGMLRLSELVEPTVGGVWGEDAPGPGLVAAHAIRGIDLAGLRVLQSANPPVRFLTPKQLNSRRIASSDLIIEASGTNCGRAWVPLEGQVAVDTVFSNFCKRFTMHLPEASVGSRFIQHLMNDAYDSGLLQAFRTGTAMPNLDVPSLLEAVEVPIGPNIWAIEPVLSALDTAAVPLLDEIRDLSATRDELLPLLMSGRVRVAEGVAA